MLLECRLVILVCAPQCVSDMKPEVFFAHLTKHFISTVKLAYNGTTRD